MPDPVAVRRVDAAATADLRRRVLRPGGPAVLPGDEGRGVVWFGVVLGGRVASTGNVRPEPAPPPLPGGDGAWRLRGMATEPALRGSGLGAAVLAAAVAYVRSEGAEVLWFNARTPARAFYERGGCSVVGEQWEDPDLGPHVLMWRDLRGH